MKEFKNNGEGWQRFAKESRSHSSATADVAEGTSHKPRYQKVERTNGTSGVRRSFNPNFTPDNRLRGAEERGGYGHKPYKKSEHSQYGRGGYDRTRNYDDDNRFNRTDYVPSSERRSSRSEHTDYNRDFNRVERPYGKTSERNYNRYDAGERAPYGERSQSGRGEGRNENRGYGSRGLKTKFHSAKAYSTRPSSEQKARGEQRRSYPRYDAPKAADEIRLNKYVAQSGLCSRREADEYIQSGAVSVNGVVVTELGTKIKPTDEVKFNDRVLKCEKLVYIVMKLL